MKKLETKISLEQYLLFYHDSSVLSRFHLNQVIEMHGFFKLHNQPKRRLEEFVDSIEPMEPTRSTLEEIISSCAFLDPDVLTADLEAIGWRDCRVRTIETLNPREEEDEDGDGDLPYIPPGATSAAEIPQLRRRRRRRRRNQRAPPADFVIVGKRRRSKRKRVSINELTVSAAAVSSVASSSYADGEDDEKLFVPPLPTSPPPTFPPPPPSSPPP